MFFLLKVKTMMTRDNDLGSDSYKMLDPQFYNMSIRPEMMVNK
jgi:hypothetical protein